MVQGHGDLSAPRQQADDRRGLMDVSTQTSVKGDDVPQCEVKVVQSDGQFRVRVLRVGQAEEEPPAKPSATEVDDRQRKVAIAETKKTKESPTKTNFEATAAKSAATPQACPTRRARTTATTSTTPTTAGTC